MLAVGELMHRESIDIWYNINITDTIQSDVNRVVTLYVSHLSYSFLYL